MSGDKKELIKKAKIMDEDELFLQIKEISQKYKKWILIGSIIVKNKRDNLINRSILINPKGKVEKKGVFGNFFANGANMVVKNTFQFLRDQISTLALRTKKNTDAI